MSGASTGRHADPCTCYNDPEYGFIVGSRCSQFMGAAAPNALNHPEPQTADPATSATPGSEVHTRPITLTEFLLARIAEDESVIERRGRYPHAIHGYDPVGKFSPQCPDCLGLHGRARVLAECGAKRAIIRLADETLAAEVEMRDASALGAQLMHADTLRALASAYAHHPDYEEALNGG